MQALFTLRPFQESHLGADGQVPFHEGVPAVSGLAYPGTRSGGIDPSRGRRAHRTPQSFVSKVETGERRLYVVEFVEFAEAIGADPSRLLAELRREAASV